MYQLGQPGQFYFNTPICLSLLLNSLLSSSGLAFSMLFLVNRTNNNPFETSATSSLAICLKILLTLFLSTAFLEILFETIKPNFDGTLPLTFRYARPKFLDCTTSPFFKTWVKSAFFVRRFSLGSMRLSRQPFSAGCSSSF